MIEQERAEKALNYLAETDEPAAKARAMAKGKEYQLKRVYAKLFIDTEGKGNNAERDALARAHPDYAQAIDEYQEALYDSELYLNRRNTAQTMFEAWRSMNANRRQAQ